MFAVVKTGGKQYKVKSGDVIEVEKLEGQPGDVIVLDKVLAIVDGATQSLQAAKVAGAKVSAEIVAQGKGEKVLIFKKKRRHTYKRLRGHRQFLTTLRISEISLDGNVTAKKGAAKPAAPAKEKKADAPKAAAKKAPAKAEGAKKPAAAKPAAKKPAAKAKKED